VQRFTTALFNEVRDQLASLYLTRSFFVIAEFFECLVVNYIQQQKLLVRAYAPLFVLLFVKGLNDTFKYFERKLTNDGKEFECKDIIQFSLNMWEKCHL